MPTSKNGLTWKCTQFRFSQSWWSPGAQTCAV